LFEFETNALSFFNSVFIVIVIAFTFYIDLYFLYQLYLQALLYLHTRQFNRESALFQWLTFKSKWLQNKVDQMSRQ